MSDQLLTPPEAAAMARVSLRTFNRSIAKHLRKVKPAGRTVRYFAADVAAYLECSVAAPKVAPVKQGRATSVERALAASPKASRLLKLLEGKRNAA